MAPTFTMENDTTCSVTGFGYYYINTLPTSNNYSFNVPHSIDYSVVKDEQQIRDEQSLIIKIKNIATKKVFNFLDTGKPLNFRQQSYQKFYLSHLYH